MPNEPNEIIEHILNGCPALANTAYPAQHDQFVKIIQHKVAIAVNLIEDPPSSISILLVHSYHHRWDYWLQ